MTAPDGSSALPHGRKARALLAYLLLSAPEAVPRERLAGLLWGGRSEEQARASLRQALYELRALSSGAHPLLVLGRAHVQVVPGRVSADVDHFRACARSGDASSLAALLGDRPRDLLEDLDGTDAVFDTWRANECVRYRDERRHAAMAMMSSALRLGDAPGAHRLANCLLAADPLDEAAASLAMEARHAQGDRDGVRHVYARLADALQRDLGVAPSEETCAVHQRLMAMPIARPPERVTADVPLTAPGDGTVVASSLSQVPLAETPGDFGAAPTSVARFLSRSTSHRRWVTAAVVSIVSAVSLALWSQRPDAADRRRLLLVQPLHVGPDDAAALALGEGLSNEVSRAMVGNDATLLVADPDRPASHAAGSVRQRDRFDVVGDAQSHGGMLRVSIKLLSARDDAILWSSSFDRSANEINALREQIASKIADVAICALGGKNPTLDDLGLETLRLYLGACENKHDDWSESARLLRQVVQRKPGFAHAWAMLAAGTATAASQRSGEEEALYKEALVCAQRALSLDAGEGEAYYARAASLPAIGQWAERMAILQAGHAVDSGNSPVDGMLAWNLASVGRWREAIAYAQQAEASDPFSPGAAWMLSQLLGYGNFSHDADTMLRRARTRFPTIGFAAKNEFFIAANAGDPRHAIGLLDDPGHALHMLPEREALWRAVIAARIDPSAVRVDEAVQAVMRSSREAAQGGMPVVEKLVLLNRLDQAYAYAATVNGTASDPEDTTIFFRSNMATFRADPRFMTIALHFGLVPIWLQTDRWPDFCADRSLPYDCRVEAQRAAVAKVAPPGRAS